MVNDIISSWNTISTNSGDIILNDTTRDDLVDILNEIKRISKVSKFTDILDIFDAHTKGFGVTDPHHTKLAELTGNILEKFYNMWLSRGNSESLDAFKDLIYQYYKYGGVLDIFNDIRDDKMIAVKSFADFFQMYHDQRVGVYGESSGIFDVSQSELRWPGEVHGFKIVSTDAVNKKLALVSETTAAGSDIWYTCDVEISMKFVYTTISASIISNKEMVIKYKDATDTEWTVLGDAIGVDVYKIPQPDGSIIDLLDYHTYKYALPSPVNTLLQSIVSTSELNHRTIQFMFSPKQFNENDTISITDFIITVDGSKTLTDDPDKKELYSNYPHNNIWSTFLNDPGISKYLPVYYTRDFLYNDTDKSFDLKSSGSLLLKFQPIFTNTIIVPESTELESKTVDITQCKLVNTASNDVLEVIVSITGDVVKDSNASKFVKITDIHLKIINEDKTVIPIYNMTNSIHSLYGIGITYNKYNGFTVYYFNENGHQSFINTTQDLFSTSSQTVELKLFNGIDNTYLVKEFLAYDHMLSKEYINLYILDDNNGYPYIK